MTWNTLDPKIREIATAKLTPRQLAVLRARLDGHSWRRIADSLHIHEATARGHHRAALDRLAPFVDELRKAAA